MAASLSIQHLVEPRASERCRRCSTHRLFRRPALLRHRVILPHRAFTLVELLVVIGIFSVLVGVLLPALASARQSAARAKATSDIRQLLTGYALYITANRGSLPFGYPPDTVNGVPIRVELSNGKVVGSVYAKRYPWRLIPYLANVWGNVFYNVAPPDDDYLKSVSPSIGLNSVFLGGHEGPYFQGYVGDRPNVGKHVAFKASEIRLSSAQIVFAESIRNISSLGGDLDGAFYLQPPRGRAPNAIKRWWVPDGAGTKAISKTSVYGGLPNGRFKGGTLVGFFDGHVATLTPEELQDMRLWSPKATHPDWDFAP